LIIFPFSLQWSSCSRILAVGSKDTATRLYAFDRLENLSTYTLGGHTEPIVGVFFDKDSLCAYTVSRNGHLAVWESSLEPTELTSARGDKKASKTRKKTKNKESDQDSEDEVPNEEEEGADNEGLKVETLEAGENETKDEETKGEKLFYKRNARHYLKDSLPEDARRADLTAADYHQTTKILVTGFSNGVFFIHEMPDSSMIHSLSISEQEICSIVINATGDWIGFGCSNLGQLLVWEWQSETYVLKQQGHFNNMACLAYSPDGQHVVTGGEDGKVKVWNVSSGFSFATFTEHTSSITGVAFAPNGKVVLSASLDGTVRAFDMARYRNFRTFASPRPAQFGCVAVDSSGDLIAAGGTDVYEIYLWSMQTGRLLEVLSGHEGPVSSLAFSPSPSSSSLASASWDKTLRIWNALAVSSSSEAIQVHQFSRIILNSDSKRDS
jgi:periodic tryptophan protein 2